MGRILHGWSYQLRRLSTKWKPIYSLHRSIIRLSEEKCHRYWWFSEFSLMTFFFFFLYLFVSNLTLCISSNLMIFEPLHLALSKHCTHSVRSKRCNHSAGPRTSFGLPKHCAISGKPWADWPVHPLDFQAYHIFQF